MATFSRFQRPAAIKKPVDDDEELAAIARKKLEAQQSPPPTPTALPAIKPASPVATAKPVSKPVTQPVAKLPPAQTLAPKPIAPPVTTKVQPAPVVQPRPAPAPAPKPTQPTAPITTFRPPPVTGTVTEERDPLEEAARARLDSESTSSGFANPGGGGIRVTGPGSRNDEVDGKGNKGTLDDLTSLPSGPPRTVREEAADELARDLDEANYGNDAVGGPRDQGPGPQESFESVDEMKKDTAIDMAKEKADEDRRDGGGPLAEGDPLEDAARARLDAERKAELDAQRAELAAGKAKALMMGQARAQLAGMGLGGGTAALESDIARTQDRSAALTMAELSRRQRDEGREDRRIDAAEKRAEAEQERLKANDEWTRLQRTMAIKMLEEEFGEDLDDDGQQGFDSGPAQPGDGADGAAVTDTARNANGRWNPPLPGDPELDEMTRQEVSALPDVSGVGSSALANDYMNVGYAEGVDGKLVLVVRNKATGELAIGAG